MIDPRKIDFRRLDPRKITSEHVTRWARRSFAISRSRRTRKVGLSAAVAFVLFGVVLYFAVPPLLRHFVIAQLAKSLNRPVSAGRIGFDPYTLRLNIDKLHVGEPDGAQSFVEVGHFRVKVSWTSLYRFAPVIGEVTITRPSIHIVRTEFQKFNFSDLLEQPSPPPKPKKPGKPFRFAVSNIRILDGAVHFDDRVLNEQHAIEHIQLGVPFIANLPADVNIFVQPLLQMVVDGSDLNIDGKAKLFASPPESVVDLKLHKLDLHRYLGYAPKRIAIKIPSGTFSCSLQLHFVNASPNSPDARPLIRVSGAVAIDQLEVRDSANAPLLELRHAVANLLDLEPLGNVDSFGKIWVTGLTPHLTLNSDGTTNLKSVIGANTESPPPPSPPPSTGETEKPPTKNSPAVSVESFELSDSAVKVADNRGATPSLLSVEDLHLQLKKFNTSGQEPAPFEVAAKIASGGAIALKGTVDVPKAQAMTELSIEQVELPPMQNFAAPFLAANVASGKFSAHATLRSDFGAGAFNLHAEPATVSIENFQVKTLDGHEVPIEWNSLSTTIDQFDLAARNAKIGEVKSDALHLFVSRGRRGELNLMALVRTAAPSPSTREQNPKPAAVETPPPANPWTYSVASVVLEKTAAHFEDHTTPQPVTLEVADLNLHVKDVSNDFAKPLTLDLAGTLNKKGSFNVSGTATPNPLTAKLKVATDHLDLAALDPYVSGKLNATIARAALMMKGDLALDNAHKQLRINYKGDAGLGDVRVLDKLTGDSFANWKALNVTRINFNMGSGAPRAHIGAIALDDFYARMILNNKGKLNLNDVVANPRAAPKSLTREKQPAAAEPAPVATANTGQPSSNADIAIGKITLQRGHINYSDNFIQPNYTADLTDISGNIGAFGTSSTAPAQVLVDGEVNGSSPIDISGSINPLAPKAFLDIKAKANGVELSGLTPYSATYAGYPIVKGTLTLDLHYLLDQGKLTADNHIVINQLTFGDRIESPHASKLPLKLAIALLKDSRGQIEVNIPVSGSLSDPQFSVTDVILGALKTLIIKAATSPFSLLGSLVAGGHGGEQIPYVEFAPGLATLSPQNREQLDALAAALQQRPALRLDIQGRVDPAVDRDGLREAMLTDEMKAEKIKDTGSGADSDGVALSPNEYSKYLKRSYKSAKFAKPSNFLGLDKSVPPEDMKKLLLANTQVTDRDLKRLADKRAAVVRRFMSEKVDPERLFLVAPKLTADGIQDKGKTTRVDLSFE
jgi:hypothetical protein